MTHYVSIMATVSVVVEVQSQYSVIYEMKWLAVV